MWENGETAWGKEGADCLWRRQRQAFRLLERVEHSLEEEGISYVECGGVTPNPRLSFAEMGVKKGIEEGVDFILAVGGGSTIDAAKAIAHGTANPGVSLWDIWTKKESLTKH